MCYSGCYLLTRALPVSYAQLARSIHQFDATADQKCSQKKLSASCFSKACCVQPSRPLFSTISSIVHARRPAALKALSSPSSSSSDILDKLYEIVFGILEKVGDAKQKRKKGIFNRPGADKEVSRNILPQNVKKVQF